MILVYEKRKTTWEVKLTYFAMRIASSEMKTTFLKLKYGGVCWTETKGHLKKP